MADLLSPSQPWAHARPSHWGATGNLRPLPGWEAQLPQAHEQPRIRAQMAMGLPAISSMEPLIGGIYNQTTTPECSSHSAVGILSLLKKLHLGSWLTFDAHELFRAGGGTAQGGYMQSMDNVLDSRGGLRVDNGTYYKELSWSVLQGDAATWVDLACAAIAAGIPIHLAILLWDRFGSAPDGTLLPNEYHAVELVGYDRTKSPVLFRGVNSWGEEFGDHGKFWISADYITRNNFAGGWHYGLAVKDTTDSGPTPPPPPPPPPPAVLKITGFSPAMVAVGDTLTINGTGFGATQGSGGVGFTFQKGAQIAAWSDTQIRAVVPEGAITGVIAVLTAGGQMVFSDGPVTIAGGSPPPQPIDGTLRGQVGTYTITGPVHLAPRSDGQYDVSGTVRTH